MRAAAAASILVQSVAFADPYLADADRGANHANPNTHYADDDAHHTVNGADHAGTDADPDQPVTDNDGQCHHRYRDLFSDAPIRRDFDADSQAAIQSRRHADGHHPQGSGEVAGKDPIGYADADPHHREGQPIRVGHPDQDPQGLRQPHANHLVSQADAQAEAQAEAQPDA